MKATPTVKMTADSKGVAPHRRPESDGRLAGEMAIIGEIGQLISSTLNIDEVYEGFAAEVRKLIPFDRIHLNLKDPDGEDFTVAYVSGGDIPGRKVGERIPLAGSISEVLCRTLRGLLFSPASEEEIRRRFPTTQVFISFRGGMRAIMAAPLISRGEVIGSLYFQSLEPNIYSERDLHLAERIGRQIAGAVANAQLFKELQEKESSLRENEARFRAIFEQAAVGVAEKDIAAGRVVKVNRRLCEILGRTEEELLATTLHEMTHPDDRGLHWEGKALLTAGKIRNLTLEKRYIRPDGETVWCSVTLSPLRREGEPLRRNIIVIQDITERKRAEQTLKETLDQLESRVRERTIELEETNTALRVLAKKGDADQQSMAESLQANVNQLVTPFLRKLRESGSDQERLTYLNILETNLDHVVSPFAQRLSSTYRSLTPKEIQIAELVRQGKRSKEIAALFGLSVGTVITHRTNIRKKLNMRSRDANLRSRLLSLG